ncbi:hypothetical protein SDRG_08208 [Saprolegnia diclina VS20]|uniref:Uncharacterized protein n=1 Tax=Saprolegnia diclina (strain VS20) TaxID=1156394 RepID=T0Q979_SAPDV|nr:hypothetical protein SDRG_08208 [Saprolegnia diclina VS20]EQC34439.1 hypothetical protein SDRG_08208 [Saprolegnia diclina VS20]|eukprot:XP_008612301.1 hypothetical protein SDRG_08208 [Saprolegnia diclina VS20]
MVVLQAIHCLDTTDDVLSFLDAVPAGVRDASLNALVTLLTANANLWPVADTFNLLEMDILTVARALPSFRKVWVNENSAILKFCRRMTLSPTTVVHANVCAPDLQANFGSWVRNIVSLAIFADGRPLNASALQENLAACARLKALAINWDSAGDAELNVLLALIATSRPRLTVLHLDPMMDSELQRCEGLLKWLVQPNARAFKLNRVDFCSPRSQALDARSALVDDASYD